MEKKIEPAKLNEWARKVLGKFGFVEEAARAAADCLVEADVQGLDTHGVSIILPRYLILLERQLIDKGADIKIINETENTALIDGLNNLGAIVAEKSIAICLEKAEKHNAAWVSVRGSNHLGFLAYWCGKIIEHGMIGFVTSNGGPDMALHGSLGKHVATNPICIGAPGKPFPLILDMASSAVSMGRIRSYANRGESIPGTWGMDSTGNPTTDPNAVLEGGALLPVGAHKGSGIAVMVDVLCGALSGALVSPNRIGLSKATGPSDLGHLFGAIKIESFCPKEEFVARMEHLISAFHGLPKGPGVDSIHLPGQGKFETAEKRRQEGIPFPDAAVKVLEEMAERYDMPIPYM